MIIRIGNVSLLPWTYVLYSDQWCRYGDNGSVKLYYEKMHPPRWYPQFAGSLDFLRPMFETYGKLGNHKHKHQQAAMDELDKFLIRMGKLTIFS
jgi:hypothetical protein